MQKNSGGPVKECQNIEWKETWSDEYLKWICGFANAQGGKLYIGVDDSNRVVGVANTQRLLEDIPNKIVTTLGIVAEVNLLSKDGRDYIEIVVPPSNIPIAYRGIYHYRSGSTKQELKGAVSPEDRLVLELSELRDGFDFDPAFAALFSWCQAAFTRIDRIHE